MDLKPTICRILVSGGKLGGVLEVLLLVEEVVVVVVVMVVVVMELGMTGEEELTPPLDLLDPNMILKELSTFSEGMDTMGELLLADLEDSAVCGMCQEGVGLLLSFLICGGCCVLCGDACRESGLGPMAGWDKVLRRMPCRSCCCCFCCWCCDRTCCWCDWCPAFCWGTGVMLMPEGGLSCGAMLTMPRGLVLPGDTAANWDMLAIAAAAAAGLMFCLKGREGRLEGCWS